MVKGLDWKSGMIEIDFQNFLDHKPEHAKREQGVVLKT